MTKIMINFNDAGFSQTYDLPPLDSTGSNYDDWNFKISALLRLRGLWGVVTGTDACPPEKAADPKEQPGATAALETWQNKNLLAKADITLMLGKEPLRAVHHYELASEVWDHLENRYEKQYTLAQLIHDIFRVTFVDTIPLEEQLNDMCDKVYRLRDLGHDLKDSLIATAMIISLPESYSSLQRRLSMQDENTLTTNFVIHQILAEEKSRMENSHGAHHKGKKPTQVQQNNSNTKKKKNLTYHYCKKKKGTHQIRVQKLQNGQFTSGTRLTEQSGKDLKNLFSSLKRSFF